MALLYDHASPSGRAVGIVAVMGALTLLSCVIAVNLVADGFRLLALSDIERRWESERAIRPRI
jgi:hypothetical protein